MASLETRNGATRVVWYIPGKPPKKASLTLHSEQMIEAALSILALRSENISRAALQAILLDRLEAEMNSIAPPFPVIARGFLARKKDEVRASTWASYKQTIETHLIPSFPQPVDLITEDQIYDWRSSQLWCPELDDGELVERYAPSTVADRLVLFKTILDTTVGKYGIVVSPAAKVALPKNNRGEQVFLSTQEFDRLRMFLRGVFKDLAFIAVNSGCRIGELLGLHVGDVVFGTHGASLIIRRSARGTKEGDTKSESSTRMVDMSPASTAVLARYALMGNRAPTAKLWVDLVTGEPVTDAMARKELRRAVQLAQTCELHPPEQVTNARGLTYTPSGAVSTCECSTRLHQTPTWHSLRHTHVAWLADCGWALDEVQVRLGHASINTTRRLYWHRFPRSQHRRLAEVDAYTTPRGGVVVAEVMPADAVVLTPVQAEVLAAGAEATAHQALLDFPVAAIAPAEPVREMATV